MVGKVHRAGKGRAACAQNKIRKGFVIPFTVFADDIGRIVDSVHQSIIDIADNRHLLFFKKQLFLSGLFHPVVSLLAAVRQGGHMVHITFSQMESLHHQRMGFRTHLPGCRPHHILIGRIGYIACLLGCFRFRADPIADADTRRQQNRRRKDTQQHTGNGLLGRIGFCVHFVPAPCCGILILSYHRDTQKNRGKCPMSLS